LRIHNQRRFYK